MIDLKTVKDREKELQDRYARMDGDMTDLYNLSDYALKNYEGVKVPGSYPLTSNRSRVFADRVIAAIQGSKIKCDVTINGEANSKSKKVEDALLAMREAIDLYLGVMGYPSLMAYMAGQVTVRGGIGMLCYPYERNGYLVPHIGLWDWRYMASGLGLDGLAWASHRVEKSAGDVLSEFGLVAQDEDVEVVDLWYPEVHEVYLEDKQAEGVDRDTGLKYTPVIEHKCNLTAFTQDRDVQKYVGESVYASLRETYKERNRQLSIRNSLAMHALTRSLQYLSAQGENAEVDAKTAHADLAVLSVEKDGGFRLMPEKDINQAAVELLMKIDEDAVYAGLSLLEYGDMPSDMTVAQLNTVLSKTQSFLRPRCKVIEDACVDLSYMFLGQLQDRKLPNVVYIKHRKIEIPKFELNEDVRIDYKLVVELPQQLIVNYSINAAARGDISQETRQRDILQVEDPEGERSRLRQERLEAVDPRLAAFRAVQEGLESKDEDERALAAYAVRLLQLDMAPTGETGQPAEKPLPGEEPAKPNVSALPALMKGGA